MKLPQCDREHEVVDALRSGRWASAWGEPIRQHTANCPVCAEVALAAQAFQREAELARNELESLSAGLPSAGLVWWKAQLAARRAAEQRAAEPIMLVERAAYALGALAAVGLGVWLWPRWAGWLHRPEALVPAPSGYGSDGAWLHRLALSWTGQIPTYLLLASAAAFLTFLVFAAYSAWRED